MWANVSMRSVQSMEREGQTPAALPLDFAAVYDAHFASLWRSARALGIPPDAVDDVLQDVFIVVHRRLPSFEGRAQVRTWLTKILVRVVATHRRRHRRKGGHDELPEDVRDEAEMGPQEQTARREAARLLLEILDTMDDDRRAVFVLAEIEQMPVSEIAIAIGENVNTTHSRLRLARRDYERHLARLRARDEWRRA
jgi:RNA polymerase sigma-70 factor (ECF subfamily)